LPFPVAIKQKVRHPCWGQLRAPSFHHPRSTRCGSRLVTPQGKNTSLRSAVFSLLRSSSGLHNLFLPAFKTHKEKQQQINSLLSEKIAKLAITI